MKKILILFFLILFITACSGNTKTGIINEKEAPDNADNYNNGEVMQRIIDINNGATPQVKPTGKEQPAQTETAASPEQKQVPIEKLTDKYMQAIIKTNLGDIKVAFYSDDSPLTVNNFLNLAKKEFYNGTKFHRVIKDFMIQGGDPLSKEDAAIDRWGTGGPGYQFQDEFNNHKLVSGSLAMANSGPNTNGSQFFIVTKESTPWLDGKHTNFGYVVEGMDIVKKIEAAETGANDRPAENIVINNIELVEK